MTESKLSCGIILARRVESGWATLMLRAYHHWDFPKGIRERGEEPLADPGARLPRPGRVGHGPRDRLPEQQHHRPLAHRAVDHARVTEAAPPAAPPLDLDGCSVMDRIQIGNHRARERWWQRGNDPFPHRYPRLGHGGPGACKYRSQAASAVRVATAGR